MDVNNVGIDAGASLWKVFRAQQNAEFEVYPAGAVDRVQKCMARWTPNAIGITGVHAAALAAELHPAQCSQVHEFEAWALGTTVLAKREGVLLPQHYLLVSIGTGTSILAVTADEIRRVTGSTLGGGTLLGLSRFLGSSGSFSELMTLALKGERGRVDLLVRDVAPHLDNFILTSDATVSSFGKLDSHEPADLAHALIWLIGENIGILCNAIAQSLGVQTIVFGGGTLSGNKILEEVLRNTLYDRGNDALFLHNGMFCGAAGAASFVKPV